MLNKFLIITLLVGLLAQVSFRWFARERKESIWKWNVFLCVCLWIQCNAQRRNPYANVPQRPAAPVQNSAIRNLNATRLSIVVSGLEGTTEGTGTLLRPKRVPTVRAVSGRTRQYRLPLYITVNSIFIRSMRTAEEQRLCLQQNRLARMNNQFNPRCQNVIRLNIPLDLIIPTNVESTAIEHENSADIIDPLSVVNYGPAYMNPNSRMAQDMYRMNYAVGDPRRARRVKRGPEILFKRSNPLFMD